MLRFAFTLFLFWVSAGFSAPLFVSVSAYTAAGKNPPIFYTERAVALSGGCEKEPLIELLDLCKVSL